MADFAFVPQIRELPQRVDIAPVALIHTMKWQRTEGIDAHPPKQYPEGFLDDRPHHRPRVGHPFDKGLNLPEPSCAAPLGKARAKLTDQILGRAVMIGEIL